MVRMKITLDDDVLEELVSRIAAMSNTLGAAALSATAKAMNRAAAEVQDAWLQYAIGKKTLPGGVPPMKNPSGDYARGIHIEHNGPFDKAIVNDSKNAEILEYGAPEIDMKDYPAKSRKSRITKHGKNKGQPYLIIPFRWGTKDTVGFRNVMPVEINNIVEKFKKMETLVDADNSDYKTPNAYGEMVGRAQYNKGYDRLNIVQIINAEPDVSINQIFNMSVMVRTKDDTGIDRAAGYLTFRVLSAKSPPGSWIKPASPARHVTDGVVKETEKKVNNLIEAGVMKDVGRL
jgi:hypothetical protein